MDADSRQGILSTIVAVSAELQPLSSPVISSDATRAFRIVRGLSGYVFDDTHGAAWFTGWMWDDFFPDDFLPTGRDTFSTDIRLVCSAGDLDFDCDVDFVDYAQLAAEWYETGCNNLNDFCNGADIIIDGAVTLDDLAKFTLRWLSQ